MISHFSLKEEAKKIGFNNKWKILQPVVIYLVAFMILSAIFGGFNTTDVADAETASPADAVVLFFSLLVSFLTIGYYRYLFAIVRGEEFTLKDILSSKVVFVSALVLNLLIGIYVFLWMLLLIIPGIIAALSYSMALYLMADDYTIKPSFAIKESKRLMNGHKMDYFLFNLSFIPWFLLGVITFGVALVWVIPYVTIANVLYYEKLLEIKNEKKSEVIEN